MSEHRYLHMDERDETEFERLAIQASMVDSATIRHLVSIEVVQNWKCLEVGAGTGSIAHWFSERVGSTGKVVATDIDLRFLRRLNAPNLEVRQHNILKEDLEKSQYNLVHCRCLLMHLPEPEKALKKMVDAVRPGGWLLVEEHDWGSCLSADVKDPSAVLWVKTWRTGFDFLLRKRIVDQYFGRRIRSLVEQLGFTDIGHEGYTYMVRGGDPISARSFVAAAQTAFNLMIAEGLLTEEQAGSVLQLQLNPTFSYPGPTLFSAWGRKSSEERRT